ncbi:hypothetical protein [uncultured Tenacibaculum sp.]|uniref:hypothetical protein n=1 Tax=uncultured Tenacibaculum sp. TaxID=174713 RepID=UPI0026068D3F|nr:hypothetical protein [uncultured Tenacibaculum sp.]
MLKLEDFKIKEIETLETIKGGDMGRPRQCLEMCHTYVRFLGWIIKQESHGDIHDD